MEVIYNLIRDIFIVHPYMGIGLIYLMYIFFSAIRKIEKLRFWENIFKILIACVIFVMVSFVYIYYTRDDSMFFFDGVITPTWKVHQFGVGFLAFCTFIVSIPVFVILKIISIFVIKIKKSQKHPESQNPRPQQ